MGWIFLATIGQFINAIVAFFDKYIVSDEKSVPDPFVYAFYTCLLTGSWVLIYLVAFIPGFSIWGIPNMNNIQKPSIQVISMSFLAGYTLFMALTAMYTALRKAEAVNVMPVVGTVSALVTFFLNYWLLEVIPSTNVVWGISLLSLGTLLVAQTLPQLVTILNTVHSGLFFALHYITMKGLFMDTSFDNGFFWSRIGMALFAVSLLLVPSYYHKIMGTTKTASRSAGIIVLIAKVLSGIAAFLILKATDLGDVAVVQALDGVKFVFILVIALVLSPLLPRAAVTKTPYSRPREVIQQTAYIVLIAIGYVILFL